MKEVQRFGETDIYYKYYYSGYCWGGGKFLTECGVDSEPRTPLHSTEETETKNPTPKCHIWKTQAVPFGHVLYLQTRLWKGLTAFATRIAQKNGPNLFMVGLYPRLHVLRIPKGPRQARFQARQSSMIFGNVNHVGNASFPMITRYHGQAGIHLTQITSSNLYMQ